MRRSRCADYGMSTGGEQGRYRKQWLDVFSEIAFSDRLTLEGLPRSDHTLPVRQIAAGAYLTF